MSRAKVICDIDGVLAEYNRPMWSLLSSIQPGGMTPLPVDGPGVWNWFPEHGARPETVAKAQQLVNDEWIMAMPPHDDFTPDAVRTLLFDLVFESELTFMTNRHTSRDSTRNWLEHLTGIQQPQVVMTSYRKHLAVAAMEPRVFIEDSAANIRDFAMLSADLQLSRCTKILINRPYNIKWDFSQVGDVVRVPSTQRALELALQIVRLA